MKFAKLTKKQKNWLLNNQFERKGIVNCDEIWEIKRVFNLNDLDEDEAIALRNTVDRIQDAVNAAACVIDVRINSFRR